MTALAVQPLPPMSTPRVIPSDILGPITATDDELVVFPRGVLGFPDCRRFVLLESAFDGIFWLQSADHSALTFVLADPFRFVPEYAVDVGAGLRAELRAVQPSDIAVFSIVTLAVDSAEAPTMNLQGPLLINLTQRLALQQVVSESRFGVAVPFTLPSAG